jgi:hypothetical protein
MTPGPVDVEEYERTHYTPAQDDVVLYSTEQVAHVFKYTPPC